MSGPAVSVTVVRSGGFAGLHREWTAAAAADDAGRWVTLIEDCPWDAATEAPASGADRFVWRIRTRYAPHPERIAEVADADLTGPWRALVDEVRAASPER